MHCQKSNFFCASLRITLSMSSFCSGSLLGSSTSMNSNLTPSPNYSSFFIDRENYLFKSDYPSILLPLPFVLLTGIE